jgi:two-component system, NtrC family, nitrogen regulation sensor histidine kinase NtrY
MKTKTQVILYLAALHSFVLIISILLWQQHKYLFLVTEVFLIISAWVAFRLYKKIVRPLGLVAAGIEALQNHDFQIKFVPTGNPDTDKLIVVYNQMIDEIRREKIKIQEQNLLLRQLINAAPVGIVLFDFDKRIYQANQTAETYLGNNETFLKGKTLEELNSPIARFLSQTNNKETISFQLNSNQKFRCQKSGFYDRGFLRHFLIIEDLTHELFEAEKAAYHKVIRMMSHEVNNAVGSVNSLLASIQTYSSALNEAEKADFCEAAQIAIERNRNLGQFMAKFASLARLPKSDLQTCTLNTPVMRIATLMQKQCEPLDIQLLVNVSESPFMVKADIQQLEQVLVNIIKNAIEAIGNKGGQIEIEMINEQRKLIIRNNGEAIKAEVAEKLFTPFFSTKQQGQGIGLALVREILTAHHIRFALATKADGFTEFEMEFPESYTDTQVF